MGALLSFKNMGKKEIAVKIVVLVVSLTLWSVVSVTTAFFWTLFFVWWAFRIDSRILAGVALFFLVCIPVFLTFEMEAHAEQFAVYVYFLLVITVMLQIIEFWREKPEEKALSAARELLSHRAPRASRPRLFHSRLYARSGVGGESTPPEKKVTVRKTSRARKVL